MLWTVLLFLFVLWLLGLITHIGGTLVYVLLILAVVLFLIDQLTGQRIAI